MKRVKRISRTFEMIFGLIGSLIAIFTGSFFIFLEHFGQTNTPFLGWIAFIAAILGLASSYYVNTNEEIAGVGFIIASIFVIISSAYINVFSAIFLMIAGVSSLFRK